RLLRCSDLLQPQIKTSCTDRARLSGVWEIQITGRKTAMPYLCFLHAFKKLFTPFQLAIARILNLNPKRDGFSVTLYGESFRLLTMPSRSILTICSNSNRPSLSI